MAQWQFLLGPAAGGREWSLTEARDRKLTVKLGAPADASCTLDGRDPLAARVEELATDLHVLRRPAPDRPTQTLYRGRVGATGDALDPDTHTVTLTSLSYRALLARRILYSDSQLTWTGVDQAAIAWGLIAQTQARPGGQLGITRGVGQATGVLRERTHEAGDAIGEAVAALSEDDPGFDWDITPVDAHALHLDIWSPQRGTDRGVILEHGGLATSVNRDVNPGDYANALRGTGAAPEGGGTDPTPVELAAADIATRPEGRWDKAYGQLGTTTAAVAQRGGWQLDQAQVIRPSYTLKLRRGAWGGPDHIWLGDPVRLVVMSGRLRVDTVLRVHEAAIAIDDDGEEDVDLTVGAPRPDPRRRATALERRLSALERR